MSTSSPFSKPKAYITLVASDNYLKGAIVLAYSIRNHNTNKLLICMVTSNLTSSTLVQLHKVYDHVIEVPYLDTEDKENLCLLGRPELGLTVTKIHLWSMDWLEQILFLDADTLVLKSLDHLFDDYKDSKFAACPDMGWPDCFNSGVFLCKPDKETYNQLCKKLTQTGSFDGGDQGLLNEYFENWHKSNEQRLPFIYNVTCTEFY
ncbi:nucleotide-diphospho-sugar transferase, partial [Neoconidiobolus thromboides FSU 785]